MNYRESPEICQSDLKLLNQSLLHYINRSKYPSSPAMELGSAFHTYIFEPEKFDNYAIKDLNLATKEGKLWKEDNKDKLIIDRNDFNWFDLMKTRIEEHPKSFILSSGEAEKELYFNFDGLACKGKLDWINDDAEVIIDLKTIADCGKAENEVRWNYDIQAAFYRQGVYESTGKWYDFVFIFAEKTYPHGVKYIKVSEQTFQTGMNKVRNGIDIYKNYLAEPNQYLGYSENFIEV